MLLKWLLYLCLKKQTNRSAFPYIHFFSAQVSGAQTMLAAGVRFSKQLKWSTEPVAAGCQDIPGNLAVRQTARMSLKSRLCHRWLISAADFSFSAAWRCHHASSLFPLESEGVVLCCVCACMCMLTCTWVGASSGWVMQQVKVMISIMYEQHQPLAEPSEWMCSFTWRGF